MKKFYMMIFLFLCGNINAQTWYTLSSGMDSSVNAIVGHNGDIYAGGNFENAGGTTAKRIAKWNGSTWQQVGGGLGPSGLNFTSQVNALTVFNNQVVAGGTFGSIGQSNVAAWNGSQWSYLGSGLGDGLTNTSVNAFVVFNGELYAGGKFNVNYGSISANNIARWDGFSWRPVGNGMDNTVHALAVYNNELYAGGQFLTADGNVATNIAKWNGTNWQAVASGFNGAVYAMTVFNGQLYAAGNFTLTGLTPASKISRWNGTSWTVPAGGMNGDIRALAVYDNELYAGGNFVQAGGNPVYRMAKYNGIGWIQLGTGTNNTVKAIGVYNENLYFGGTYTSTNGLNTTRIARFNNRNVPVAAFTSGPHALCISGYYGSASVAYTDQSTGNPTSWQWTFEGATPVTHTSQNPTANYECYNYNNNYTPYIYDVILIVSNSAGSDTITANDYVEINRAYFYNLPYNSCAIDTNIPLYGVPGNGYFSGPGINNNYFNPATAGPGTHFITYYNFNGNFNCSYTQPVTVTALPAVPVITQNISDLHSSAASGNQWYDSNGIITGATGQIFTPSQAGIYQVKVTDGMGCSSVSDNFQYGGARIGFVQEVITPVLSVYPNPSSGIVNIHFENEDAFLISVRDLTGREVFRKNTNQGNDTSLDLSHLSGGSYILMISTAERIITERIYISGGQR